MLSLRAKKLPINLKFSVNYDSNYCYDPINESYSCENGWYYDKEESVLKKCEANSTFHKEVIVNSTYNPFGKLNCSRDVNELYPGDSYVDWISV